MSRGEGQMVVGRQPTRAHRRPRSVLHPTGISSPSPFAYWLRANCISTRSIKLDMDFVRPTTLLTRHDGGRTFCRASTHRGAFTM